VIPARDPLTDISRDDVLWTRVNSNEAVPGVMMPITWSFYGRTLETYGRRGFADLGVIPSSAVAWSDDASQRFIAVFHGRLSINVNVVRQIMSGLPGVTGDQIERDMLGSVRTGVVDHPYPGRTLAVLWRAPLTIARHGRGPRLGCEQNHSWWSAVVGPDGPRPGVDARALLREAIDRFGASVRLQAWVRMLLQGSIARLTELAAAAGAPDAAAALLSGGAATREALVADDLFALADGRLTLDAFIARHGYHGPSAGEVSSRSWREDPTPIERLLASVRRAEPPATRRARASAERTAAVRTVLDGLPAARRAEARLLLRLAPLIARTIEQTKTSFLITGDAARAAVRGIGRELAAAGRLDAPEDAFHLFAQELYAAGAADLRELIAERRAQRAHNLSAELPETWTGQPVPVTQPERSGATDRVGAAGSAAAGSARVAAPPREFARITGLGVSPGVAEGRVRIIRDPADVDAEIEPGDILVCPTTDPSWLALMTIAAALVIDIGAAASHGAIVARELGVPCVIGTKIGTAAMRDGDRVRVDGSAGIVERL
jgi:pyruvate,water dikinase